MDIREKTCVIIRKNGLYLVGAVLGSKELRWSCSAYDAWRTRDIRKARKAEKITGGVAMLFNPIVGQIRIL